MRWSGIVNLVDSALVFLDRPRKFDWPLIELLSSMAKAVAKDGIFDMIGIAQEKP